jgi:hypothetical protein
MSPGSRPATQIGIIGAGERPRDCRLAAGLRHICSSKTSKGSKTSNRVKAEPAWLPRSVLRP